MKWMSQVKYFTSKKGSNLAAAAEVSFFPFTIVASIEDDSQNWIFWYFYGNQINKNTYLSCVILICQMYTKAVYISLAVACISIFNVT